VSEKETTRSGGIGFCGLLTILFIGLKLTGYIDWSWWWVLSPIWITLAVLATVVAICGLIMWVCK
jgi:hypothetical protein